MTIISGVDYPWSHPGGAALQNAGIKFACRYLSHDATKNLTRTEADDLAAHGVSCVVVWETTANRASADRSAGIADAHDALSQAAAAGMPAGRPIYFAVDWDAAPSVVVAYFQGVASVLGLARTGVYGGYKVVKYLLDHQLAAWAWQTAAWSGGQWDPRAVLRQPATTVRINGVTCDRDTAHAADYGQWTPGKTPIPLEEDVPLTDAEIAKVAAATRDAVLTRKTDNPTTSDDSTLELLAMLWDTGKNAGQANANSVKLLAQITAMSAAITALAAKVGSGDDVTTIVTAVQQAIENAVVKVDVSVGDNTPQRGN